MAPVQDVHASRCFVFLCNNAGQEVEDFGRPWESSAKHAPASSLVRLIEPNQWSDFVEAFQTRSAVPPREFGIRYGGSARSLELRGFQVPSSILIFGKLAAAFAPDRSAAFPRRASVSVQPVSVSTRTRPGEPREDASSPLWSAIHDLRNRISGIISSCEYLTEYSEGNLDPIQLEIAHGIDTSARAVLQLSGTVARLTGLTSLIATNDAGAR